MSKYYRVKQDTFLWNKGAILQKCDSGYRPISDLWDATDVNESEYISSRIIESDDNAVFFERVYDISILGKVKYLGKEAAQKFHDETHKEK